MLTAPPRICVLQVPPFDPTYALGGAEVMAVELVRTLATRAKVAVLHGVAHGESFGVWQFPGIAAEIHGAFPLDEHVREHGHIRPCLSSTANQLLDRADVLVTIERSLDRPSAAKRIVTLGGVGYPHTLDVLAHGAWDKLVVPSQFVAGQVAVRAPQASGVEVLANGVDTALLSPSASSPAPADRVRLLLASRPTSDKGLHRVLGLARSMQEQGTVTEVVCFSQSAGFGPDDFMADAKEAAAGLNLRVLPWRTRDQMPDAYRSAHLTLCLGDGEEGFGLVAAESVAAGTPVLATPAGFLPDLLPPGYGIYLVDFDSTPAELAAASRRAMKLGPDACRSLGRPYVVEHYGMQRMRNEIARTVQEITC